MAEERAFPGPDYNGEWKGPFAEHGMTLRDWFATAVIGPALTTAKPPLGATHEELFAEVAKIAYMAADAMIEARK